MNSAAENRCFLLISQLKELRSRTEQERMHFEQERNFLDAQLSMMEMQLQALHSQIKSGAGQQVLDEKAELARTSSPASSRTVLPQDSCNPKPPSSSPPALLDTESVSDIDSSSDEKSEAGDMEIPRVSITDEHHHYELGAERNSFGVVGTCQLSLPNFQSESSEASESRKDHGRKGSALQFVDENAEQEISVEPESPKLDVSGMCSLLASDPHRVSQRSSSGSLPVPSQSLTLGRISPGLRSRNSRTSLENATPVARKASERLSVESGSRLLLSDKDRVVRRSSFGAPLPLIGATLSTSRVVEMHSSIDNSESAGWCLLPQWDQLAWKTTRKMARVSMDMGEVMSNTKSLGGSLNSSSSLIDSVRSRIGQKDQLLWTIDKNRMNGWVLQPNSMRNLIWVCLSIIFIIYDLITIPLLAFKPSSPLFDTLDWCTAVFWTLDIPKAFLTGVIDSEGQVDTRIVSVAFRYLKRNFFSDIICVVFHWLGLGFSGCDCAVGIILQVLRFLRVWKLAHLSRSAEVEVLYMDYLQSEELILFGQIALHVMELLLSGHIIACIWYGIGATHENDSNWVDANQLIDSSVFSRYVWAIHWSLAQFTGELVYDPENVKERLFTCVVLFLTFIISCFFVSGITGAVTRLHIIKSTQSKQMAQLRRYLDHHHISASLAVRIQHNATHAITEQKRNMPENDVALLGVISEPLRRELHFEMHSPSLISHAFFTCYHDYVSPECIQKVCHLAVSNQALIANDVVFSNNELPVNPKMYFIEAGRLDYIQDGAQVMHMAHGENLHASEANLWTRWMHVGTLRSVIPSSILALDSEEFASIICIFPTCHAHNYAEGFVALLNNCDKQTLSDLYLAGAESLKYEAFPEVQVRRSILSETGRGSSRRASDRLPSFFKSRSASQMFSSNERTSQVGKVRSMGSMASVKSEDSDDDGILHIAPSRSC